MVGLDLFLHNNESTVTILTIFILDEYNELFTYKIFIVCF